MEYIDQLRDSHTQHEDYNNLCIVIILTEPIDKYRQRTTRVKHTYKQNGGGGTTSFIIKLKLKHKNKAWI